MPNVHLNPTGAAEAAALGRRLAGQRLDLLQSSPQPRAHETAQAIGVPCGLAAELVAAVDEIDLGEWTGQTFAALAGSPAWRRWNEHRAEARPPGGESMREAQARTVDHLETTARRKPGARVAVVSHADVIKAALLHYLGTSLDHHDRIEIAPASISTLVVGPWGAKLIGINELART